MKVWLDDVRAAPDGWVACRWPEEVIELLKTGNVEEVSLDHDLDDPLVHGQSYCSSAKERTGYDVLVWIEEQVFTGGFVPPTIHVHSANTSAKKKMLTAVKQIEWMANK